MPGNKKKKFIHKKNAVTFHLVHRSQRDPLQADDDAPERVLLEVDQKVDKKEKLTSRKEEERKYGVFYDDDYDYLQHLRDVNELYEVEPIQGPSYSSSQTNKHVQIEDGEDCSEEEATSTHKKDFQLPSSVFASDLETDVGLLNKAAPVRGPQPDWDPDIVAALDEDFDMDDPDNVLEDDFMAMANAAGEEMEGEYDGNVEMVEEDEEQDFDSDDNFSDGGSYEGSFGDQFSDEETKSRFTNYSMTSSVIRRNEGLTLLDDRFEKIYEEYDEDEIGALDQAEIEGTVSQGSVLLNNVLEDFEKQETKVAMKDVIEKGDEADVVSESDDDEADLVKMVIKEPKEKWDCESILSTYSTLYNHPRKIEEPKNVKPRKKTESSSEKGMTLKELENDLKNSNRLVDKACTYRPKGETTEERKQRKKAIKAERMERRAEKKANKLAFKSEQLKQDRELLNVKRNLQGIKIE